MAVLFCMPKLILRLLIQPALGRRIESDGKPNSHFRADTSISIKNGTQSLSTNAKSLSRSSHRKSKRLETKLPYNFTRVRRVVHQHHNTSMIVFVIYHLGITVIKSESHTPISTYRD